MRKSGAQSQRRTPGWWNRQEAATKVVVACLSAITVILIVVVVVVGTRSTGNESPVANASSTTLGPVAETSTTATTAADQTSTTATTAADQASTTSTSTTTGSSTTVAIPTADTADHAADIRAQYPSTELFTNSNWATLDQAPASHLGAAVDVIGQITGDSAIDANTGYLTWHLSIPAAGGNELQVLCRTNVNLDRSLLSAGGWVEVRGVAVGAQPPAGTTGAAVYVETVQPATQPAATATP
jgi:hypothetical protein